MLKRRDFLKIGAGAAGGGLAAAVGRLEAAQNQPAQKAAIIGGLKPMISKAVPITDNERQARMEKARRLMVDSKIQAIVMEGGSSLFYFTGVQWSNSERIFACVFPARGELAWICPKFEEGRARELIRFGTNDVRTWEEDESPYKRIVGVFKDRGIQSGRVGFEERVRFFLYDGVRTEGSSLDYVSADPITIECRVIKSPAEIALMQLADDITVQAFKATFALLREGMTKAEFGANAAAAHAALGAPGGNIGANFGESTALPHGSIKPRNLREGDVVLADGGCSVDGYRSDITRSIVFGKPTQKQKDIWELEKRAQAAAFKAAQPGTPCEAIDAAARKVITDAGFGPDYKVPGLPHRTGHGIGLDGHEWINLVRGNTAPLRPGMCFTDEPMIVIPGEFGIRLEDDFYVTDKGPRFFSQPAPSIDKPFV